MTNRNSPVKRAALGASVLLLSMVAAGPAHAQIWGSSGFDMWSQPFSYTMYSDMINNSGQTTGSSYNFSAGRDEATIFERYSSTQLGGIAGRSYGQAINNLGVVTGSADVHADPYFDQDQAMRADAGGMEGLGTLPGYGLAQSLGTSINDAGWVTGNSDTFSGMRAFRFNGTTMEDLGTLWAGWGSESRGNSINSSGWVTGSSSAAPLPGHSSGFSHAFRFGPTGMEDLGTLGTGWESFGMGINDAGEVAGFSATNQLWDQRAFRYGAGGMEELGALAGQLSSYGFGIDNSGRVVGYVETDVGRRAAFWEGTTGYFLDAVVGNGWSFRQIYGISDNGRYIAAAGSRQDQFGYTQYADVVIDQGVAFESTTTPEPVSMALLGTGLAGLGAIRRRRRKQQEEAAA